MRQFLTTFFKSRLLLLLLVLLPVTGLLYAGWQKNTEGLLSVAPDENWTHLRLDAATAANLLKLKPLHGMPLEAGRLENQVVLITFFASWCPPCRDEFKELAQVLGAFRGEPVEVIGINLFEDFDGFSDDKRLAFFLKKTNPPFTIIKGDQAVSNLFGKVERIPSLFMFDRRGRVAKVFVNTTGGEDSPVKASKLQALIRAML